ncbi:MAG: metalloregulator ArsR/SmtB family transcription factor [Flaviflexus sp.]|nr:metalloregulator ArsR/SmtB family transcription factor [Flaviflexus sp.]
MTVSPSHLQAVSRLGYALSDDVRAKILLRLRDGESYPSDLAAELGVTRQVMSNQLACLRGCGLVEAHRQGRRVGYRLSSPHLKGALEELLIATRAMDPSCCDAGAECRTGGEMCSCCIAEVAHD